MIVVRQLADEELSRASEIDVSEGGHAVYRYARGELRTAAETWQRPRWNANEWKNVIDKWTVELKWDVMVGAFAGEQLVELTSVRYRLEGTTAQLVALYVSRASRRLGVAARLTDEIVRLAKVHGARDLYVSATPSESAVGFYLSQGFRPTASINKELCELEPEDIHMVRAF